MNWFVALKGSVTRHTTLAELEATWTDEFKIKHADRIPGHSAQHLARIPKAWEARSEHILCVSGWGDTPEEAIRDFEDKMKLPGAPPK